VLMHVAGKPILGHILDELRDEVGVTDLVLVVGYLGEMIVDYVKDNYDFNLEYVYQEELLGLGHAIMITEEQCAGEPAMIVLGDTIFKADFKNVLQGDCNYIGVKEVADPRRFGVVELDEGKITKFVEKPENPPTNLAIVGLYYIKDTRLMYDCLKELVDSEKKTAGEFQLTDALQLMLEKGEEMRTFLVDGWYDCGKAETLLETNRRLLSACSKFPAQLAKNNIILEPVFVEDSAQVESSIIGPYVSIAGNSLVKKSVIRNTIINEGAQVNNMLLEESLIGKESAVNGRMNRLNVGDSSQLDYS
jgi:glucose-1-phosphate thymidylyltransferase